MWSTQTNGRPAYLPAEASAFQSMALPLDMAVFATPAHLVSWASSAPR